VSPRSSTISPASAAESAEDRVAVYNWQALAGELSDYGCAVLLNLLSADECRGIVGLYSDESHFRSHVHMARHGFGKGEYRYFKYPLPQVIGGLRTALYPHLATIANEWNGRMAIPERYPATHASFLKRCHDAGQGRPTPRCCSMFRVTSIACTRTSTAISHSQSRLRSSSLSRARISLAASSCSPSNGRACKAVLKSCRFGKAMP
jgi:hypothetical protein